jgi:hypothetical protein
VNVAGSCSYEDGSAVAADSASASCTADTTSRCGSISAVTTLGVVLVYVSATATA